MICRTCYRPYNEREHDSCPHCRGESRALIFFLLFLLGSLVLALHCFTSGCSAGGARKAIVAASEAAEAATKVVRNHCRHLAEKVCKTNPCPELIKCHVAEIHIVDGAAALSAGLKAANEVIDND